MQEHNFRGELNSKSSFIDENSDEDFEDESDESEDTNSFDEFGL